MLLELQKNRALFQPWGHCGKILSKEANANGSCRDKQLVLKNTVMLIFWISLTVFSGHGAFSLSVNGLRSKSRVSYVVYHLDYLLYQQRLFIVN